MPSHEVNFDGLVGPTHNYAGLAFGNTASMEHKLTMSHPRQAALESLEKMKFLLDLGLKQAVLPPQERPSFSLLRQLGFTGSDEQVLEKSYKQDRNLLAAAYSASSMWAANAATVSPSADTADGRVHFTPANLISNLHRSMEAPATARMLQAIFADEETFAHHPPLPAVMQYGDEGAANHMRLCAEHSGPGVEIFAYGQAWMDASQAKPVKFPARQTLESAKVNARRHQLTPHRAINILQNPEAIDAGAFHNDVLAMSNVNVLLYHQRAYARPMAAMDEIRRAFASIDDEPLHFIEVRESAIPLADAIRTYLFNSQLVTLPSGLMSLIAPIECRDTQNVLGFIQELISRDTPIKSAHFMNVRQSMRNGGGPACLRLRVVLTDEQIEKTLPGVFLTNELYGKLKSWIEKHYRDRLMPDDLKDIAFVDEIRAALDELTQILQLGSIYDFQR